MSADPNALFERAKAALVGGNPAAAAQDARAVLRLAPSAWPALHLLAVAERDSGRPLEARQAFEAALAAAPDNPDIHGNFADLLSGLGEHAGAVEHARRAVDLRPGQAGGWLRLSLCAHAAGDAGTARAAVERAVRVAPNDASAWAMLGARRHADGDGAAADEAYRRALALTPDHAPTVRALAELEAERGGDALPLFDRAAALNPRDAETVLQRAAYRTRAGDATTGRAELEALARATPGWISPPQALARLAISEGRPDDACLAFVEALKARPRDRDMWGAYLQTLVKLEDYAAVLSAAREARAALGDHPVLDGFVAVGLDGLGEHDEAGRLLQRLDAALGDQSYAEALVANLLSRGEIEAAARRAEAGVRAPGGRALWAYLTSAWRLLEDPRWTWLEAPGFVQAIDLPEGEALAASAADVLRRLHTARAAPLGQTLRGGSQTEGDLFLRREPQIQALASAIRAAVQAYVDALPSPEAGHPLLSGPRAPVRFSGSWSVRLLNGGLHVNHVHPDGWLSSAFYVALPAMALGSAEGWLALGEPPKALGLDLAPFRMIEPKPGRLALFPSYTWHGTRPFPEGERLTVAFDVAAG